MKSNAQIETLNKELKTTVLEIEDTDDPNRKTSLEAYANELRANIQDLCSSVELDYQLIAKVMLFKATANALLYRICKREELHTIILELIDIGVPREVMTADKDVLTRYLRDIEYKDPKRFERYHEFIRIVQSKSFKTSPQKKQEFMRDFHWLMDDNSLATQSMEAFELDSSEFQRILGDQETKDFERLVDRYHQLQTL